jgi:hypothetical protein
MRTFRSDVQISDVIDFIIIFKVDIEGNTHNDYEIVDIAYDLGYARIFIEDKKIREDLIIDLYPKYHNKIMDIIHQEIKEGAIYGY